MEYLPRTCTEYEDPNHPQDSLPVESEKYRQYPAYVLLGDPGMGKTKVFKQESKQPDCEYVTARDLITFQNKPEWHNKTLFIDGLDEVRAGSGDARSSFDTIRSCLEKLGRPRFRLSCREADWITASDKERLEPLSPDRKIHILRLDPLTEIDIKEILTKNYSTEVQDPAEFIQKAKAQNILNLAKNPQILHILVSALKGGSAWPSTKLETFDLACRQLLHEHNPDHAEISLSTHYSIEKKLEAAGFLYALLLIARKLGISLRQSVSDDDYPYLDDIQYDHPDLLRTVIKSKLFTVHGNKVNQLHRVIAEYLSAYYINTSIRDRGLPVERILALITGKDGVVVTELRGLFAWLTALCHQEREVLLGRDPFGVVLYGDVKLFSMQDKIKILNSIKQEAERYPFFRFSENWSSEPLGALGTEDMTPEFREILSSREISDAQERLISCVLDALQYGNKLISLSDCLIKIMENAEHWPRNRQQALSVLLQFHKDNNDLHKLKKVADHIITSTISDPNDELLGILLKKLYPAVISANEIFNYLHNKKQSNLIGRYYMFWTHDLPSENISSDGEVFILLNELSARSKSFPEELLSETFYHTMTSRLLSRGIELHGDRLSTQKLSEWLKILSKNRFMSFNDRQTAQRIRTWFKKHPDCQKALYSLYAEKCRNSAQFSACMFDAKGILNHSDEPADYGEWCIEKTKAALKNHAAEAEYFFYEAIRAYRDEEGISPQSIESLQVSIKGYTELESWLNAYLYPSVKPEREKIYSEIDTQYEAKKLEWMKSFVEQKNKVFEGTAEIGLMYQLGGMYLGDSRDANGETPMARLEDFFKADQHSIATVIAGLKNSLKREDLPNVTDIIKLSTQHKTHAISYACRAGLDALFHQNPQDMLQLRDDQLRKGVAFYLTNGFDEEAEWYLELVRSRPELVADVLIKYTTIALRSGKQHIRGIYALPFDEIYIDLANHATIPILASFPPRCTSKQLVHLDPLLRAALRFTDHQQLQKLVKKKLGLRSMNISQRIHWLATGFIISPSSYQREIIEYISNQERRIEYLAKFLSYKNNQWSPTSNLPAWAIALLLRLLAFNYAPSSYEEYGHTSFFHGEFGVSDYLFKLINQLAADPSDQATRELENLLAIGTLSQWHQKLRSALYSHFAVKREYHFSHTNIRQVVQVFHNLAPANAADLAALTLDHIRNLANQIQNSATNDYRQYWRSIQDGIRRTETECRDTFLSDLRNKLAPLGISAQSEGHYVNDARADIRISYDSGSGRFNVPIEVKCNDSRDLWYAMHNQLISKYTRDPEAQGYGIYLVFWFGADKTSLPPQGLSPRSTVDLENQLTAQLSEHEEKLYISVCVIDCTGSQ